MKLAHLLAAAAIVALGACQPPATTPGDAPAAGEPEAAAPAPVADLPCGVLGQRDWQAEVNAGSPATLTVSGEIDLGTPGYSVSLARDDAEPDGATSTTLSLRLAPPSGVTTQVVTPHAVRYFGPARGPYTSVQIQCDGAAVTTIAVSP